MAKFNLGSSITLAIKYKQFITTHISQPSLYNIFVVVAYSYLTLALYLQYR